MVKFELQQRSYSADIFRPTPVVDYDENGGLLIVATPWGNRNSAKRVIQIIKDYVLSFRGDSELTSPFPRLSCLSSNANNLRIATLMANDVLYREENKNEFITGVELFVASLADQEMAWLQAGHPHLFLARKSRGILPLGCHMDLPMDVSSGTELLAPLPSTILGLDASANLIIGSFVPRSDDQLILLSRSHVPLGFLALASQGLRFEQLSNILAQSDPGLAFWLGLINLGE